jgi:DNA-directed RNA polymerase subunit beta'
MTKKTKVFYNYTIDKKALKQIMAWAFNNFGSMKASYLANQLKDIGFQYSTKAGISISIEDLKVPPTKRNLIKFANKKVEEAELQVKRGEITEVERFQKIIKTWNITSEALKDQVVNYFKKTDPLNSIYIMAFSGARGNISQVRQLVGMRGLMADPNGQIINLPILTNFREGLTITDYIISSYGARKGLVDTALRTADSGYLTRRLIDVAQDIITREKDCKTKYGITLTSVIDGNRTLISLSERITGRVLTLPIKKHGSNKIIAQENQEITPLLANQIEQLDIKKVTVRSPLTCSSSRSICQQCYGWNLAYGKLIDLGEAVGIIAAQSIGEPGTQLTMRTFHTGGVFTAEPSRQVRAKFSGRIKFSKTLKTHTIRTEDGKLVSISENESYLDLLTYDNLILKLEIFPKTLIFVKNNNFVRKNEIIFELTPKIRKVGGEKAFKYIYANESGEVYFEELKASKSIYQQKFKFKDFSNCLVWIFFGQVFTVSLNAKLKLKSNLNVAKNTIITQSKFLSVYAGKINFSSKKELNIIQSSKIFKNLAIYIETNVLGNQECVIYGSLNRRIVLKTVNSTNENKPTKIGNLININYRTKTGGIFYSTDFNNQRKQKEIKKNKVKKTGGTIFYLPESTYEIDQSINQSQIYVKNGDYIKFNKKIFKNTNSNISGVIYILKNKRVTKEVLIKPGRLFHLEKNKHKTLKLYNRQLVYPGEILFQTIKIKHLSFTEITNINNKSFLGIFPIVRYEITNSFNEFSFFFSNSKKNSREINFNNFEVQFQFAKKIKSFCSLQILNYSIFDESLAIYNDYIRNFEITQSIREKKKLKLSLTYKEIINLHSIIPNELKKENVTITKLAQNNQFTEPYTNLNAYQSLTLSKSKILKIKQQTLNNEKKVLLVTSNDYQSIYSEQSNIYYQKNKLVKLNRREKNNIIFKSSGFIDKKFGNSFFLKKATPYLFSQGARIEKRSGDLIKQGEKLGQLIYERTRTEDIIQGLPRVEEILEARKPKFEANLAIRPGIVSNIKYTTSEFQIWVVPNRLLKSQKDYYKISYSQRLLIGLFEFINVGQPLTDAPINAHTLLDIYYSYFKSIKLFSAYDSAYRSFRKIHALFLNSVQAVYYSQGVLISDKHIEIIIKQMTGKVQIISSGHSPLLPDEFVDLKQVSYINSCLKNKDHAVFRPIILGITKASLKTNSFISAASFQHTTKILTEAAIQGKNDWLRGLKENVIVGRLIPAGTGFNRYSDISYMQVKIPSLLTDEKKTISSPLPTSSIKYKKIKNRVKFKFLES